MSHAERTRSQTCLKRWFDGQIRCTGRPNFEDMKLSQLPPLGVPFTVFRPPFTVKLYTAGRANFLALGAEKRCDRASPAAPLAQARTGQIWGPKKTSPFFFSRGTPEQNSAQPGHASFALRASTETFRTKISSSHFSAAATASNAPILLDQQLNYLGRVRTSKFWLRFVQLDVLVTQISYMCETLGHMTLQSHSVIH